MIISIENLIDGERSAGGGGGVFLLGWEYLLPLFSNRLCSSHAVEIKTSILKASYDKWELKKRTSR
jgi:hypothetical protein